MNADRLIYAIGNVSDKYVLEYDDAVEAKKKSRIRFHPRWSIAACLVLVAAVTALILPYITRPDDSLNIKVHIFSSYEEFSAVVPDIKIVENLSSIDGVELEIYGTLQDVSISDTTKAENFAHFDIEAKVGGQLEAVVTLKLNDVGSAEKYIKTAALTTKTEINGIQVHYAYNKDMEYWDSVVVADQNYFNIRFYSDNEQELLEFLTILLKNK